MATSFAGHTLPNASKIAHDYSIALRDSLLLVGTHMIQSNANMGFSATYRCFGTWAEFETILAHVGSSGTLITEAEPSGYTNCYISSIKVLESDNPNYFHFDVGFSRDTR